MSWSRSVTLGISSALGSALLSGVAAGADSIGQIDANADSFNRAVNLAYGWSGRVRDDAPRRARGSEPTEPQPVVKYAEREICYDDRGQEFPAPEAGVCASGIPRTETLNCDSDLVPPTWQYLENPDGSTTQWERLDLGACGPVLPVLTVEDFRSLPIPAPVLRLQPEGDWVLVNIATIVMTDPAPVVLRTTLGGYGVDVEARPVLFTYDFGDGHDLVTRSPGAPYPDHDTFHEYEAPGTYAVTLTTEWAGRFRVDGDPTWREVTGTVSTSTTSPEFEAQERTSRLVSGLCTDRPKPPDC